MTKEMVLKQIGVVKSPYKEPTFDRLNLKDIFAEIVVNQDLKEALDGLEGFSHIIVLYWLHKAKPTAEMKTFPMGRQDVPKQGLFAVRTTRRPNPIGKTTVRLLSREGNVLKVQGLDAIDGSPVIDIKCYIPGAVSDVRVPDWVGE